MSNPYMTKISNVPPAKYTPKEMQALFAEHTKLRAAYSSAQARVRDLTNGQLDVQAQHADEAAIATAFRAGKTVNDPNQHRAKLAADRTTAEVTEIQTKIALDAVTTDVSKWVHENSDALLEHETDILNNASAEYAASIEVTLTARQNYYEAIAAAKWSEALAHGNNSQLSWIGARYETQLNTALRMDALEHDRTQQQSVRYTATEF